MICAITAEGEVLLKREYRYACQEDVIECPAGMFDAEESDPLAEAVEMVMRGEINANSSAHLILRVDRI